MYCNCDIFCNIFLLKFDVKCWYIFFVLIVNVNGIIFLCKLFGKCDGICIFNVILCCWFIIWLVKYILIVNDVIFIDVILLIKYVWYKVCLNGCLIGK